MASERSLTKEIAVFVKFHLQDKHCFAPFTGQDYSAWAAFLYACQLYGRSDSTGQRGALDAMIALVRSAQQKEDVLAVFKKSIPGVLDWNFEPEVWGQIAPRSDFHARYANHPRRSISVLKTGLPLSMGDEAGLITLVWPCEDGPYECPHTNSKPAKRRSHYAFIGEVTDEEWFECRDCKATWRPANPDRKAQ
jgi:hypothetical protein